MKNTPIVYDIVTVADFLKVPPNRRRACVREFATWLAIHDDVLVLMTPPEHPNCVTFDGIFRWRDDRQRKITIEMWVRDPGAAHEETT